MISFREMRSASRTSTNRWPKRPKASSTPFSSRYSLFEVSMLLLPCPLYVSCCARRYRPSHISACPCVSLRPFATQRYRDSHDEIRVSCVAALGRCMELLPVTFLGDTYLKYMGWMLNDRSPAVRGTVLTRLVATYKLHSRATDALSKFTARFEARTLAIAPSLRRLSLHTSDRLCSLSATLCPAQKRFLEMIADADKLVSVKAIKLVAALNNASMLEKVRWLPSPPAHCLRPFTLPWASHRSRSEPNWLPTSVARAAR